MSYDDDYNKIYPTLPTAPPDQDENYRLNQIADVEQFLRSEKSDRSKLEKKIGFWKSTLEYVDSGLIFTEVVSAGGGIALISTSIDAPIGIALESLAILAGLIQLWLKRVNKKISLRSSKHNRIVNAAETSLDQIRLKISMALEDGVIDIEEFKSIIKEKQRYLLEKEKIHSKTKKSIDEVDTKKIIEQAKKDERQKILKKFQSVTYADAT